LKVANNQCEENVSVRSFTWWREQCQSDFLRA
jgi:hypothetical protein